MKKSKNIFNGKLLGAAGIALILSLPAFAATNNGCDKDSNDRINPEIALCSTHVYNIGGTTNPSTESDKQLMRDVVALKSTVMTQQMYRQYEYLETMVRRFKTQLEKAVLTTKLQAAGADASSAGSSSYSGVGTSSNAGSVSSRSGSSKYVVLNDAKNCGMVESTSTAVLQCLLENINKTIMAVDNNDINGARRQLEADMDVAKNFGVSKPKNCTVLSNGAKSVSDCAYSLRMSIMSAIEDKQKQNRQNTLTGTAQQQIP